MADLPKKEGTYTYADYCTWPDEERWELLDGVAYDMSPAPTRKHQGISRELMLQLYALPEGSPCRL